VDRHEYQLAPDKEELVELYKSTPEGEVIWKHLDKIPRYCSAWMSPALYVKMRKELFIQWCESHPSMLKEIDE